MLSVQASPRGKTPQLSFLILQDDQDATCWHSINFTAITQLIHESATEKANKAVYTPLHLGRDTSYAASIGCDGKKDTHTHSTYSILRCVEAEIKWG